MRKRHNTLNDSIFRNSKYIHMVSSQVGCSDFRKEYKEQYDFMLDTFSTLILLNNCFFSDSNISLNDKVENAQKIIGKYLFSDFDENVNETISENGVNKYTTRFIQSICEKQCTHIYRRINSWYFDYLYNYTPKGKIDNVLNEIEEEIDILDNVNFDYVVKEELSYEKNKNSNSKFYICKFDSALYDKQKDFIAEYEKEYKENHINKISKEELSLIGAIYTLMAKLCNGITKYLSSDEEKNYNITIQTTPYELYDIYLKSLNLEHISFTQKIDSYFFMLEFMEVVEESCLPKGIDINSTMNNYDFFYFMYKMENYFDDLIFKDEQIQKEYNDLKDIYNLFKSNIDSKSKMNNIFEQANEMIINLINKKRISNYFVRVS